MKRKIILGVLLLAIILNFISCKDTTSQETETTNSENTTLSVDTATLETIDEKTILNIPDDIDYSGKSITILQRSGYVDEIYSAEVTASPLSNAVYERNRKLEETTGITLLFVDKKGTNTTVNSAGCFHDTIRNAYSAQEDSFQIVSNYAYFCTALISEGIYSDLSEYSDILDTSKVWWNQSYIESSTINEKYYFVTGDIATSLVDEVEAVFVNLDMVKDYFGDEDFYQKVIDGEWILESAEQYAKMVAGDANTGTNQRYGFVTYNNSLSIDGFLLAVGVDILNTNERGKPELTMQSPDNLDKVEALRKFFFNTTGVTLGYDGVSGLGTLENPAKTFAAGESLFFIGCCNTADNYLNDSNLKYGIVPMPKYDLTQESYYSTPHDEYSTIGIPSTVNDPEMAATVLQAMGYLSYKQIRPVVYENLYKYRYLSDEKSAIMFDFLIDGTVFDMGYIYSSLIDNPVHIFRNYIRNNQEGTLSSSISTQKVIITQKLESMLVYFYNN